MLGDALKKERIDEQESDVKNLVGSGFDSKWIWYPGDFELYHGMKQNFEREERGFFWPAYWHISDFRKHVVFQKEYDLTFETTFRVIDHDIGHVQVKWEGEKPELSLFKTMNCEFPLNSGTVKISWDENHIKIFTDRDGGIFILGKQKITLPSGKMMMLKR